MKVFSRKIEDGPVSAGPKKSDGFHEGPRREYGIEHNGGTRTVGQFEDSARGAELARAQVVAQLGKMVGRSECTKGAAGEAMANAVRDGVIPPAAPTPIGKVATKRRR